jgi:hypothetical protein
MSDIRNAAAQIVDRQNLIYQIDPVTVEVAATAVFDGGIRLEPGDDYATLDELMEAEIKPGYFATCKASGMFRLGGTPDKLITADADVKHASHVYRDSDLADGVSDKEREVLRADGLLTKSE